MGVRVFELPEAIEDGPVFELAGRKFTCIGEPGAKAFIHQERTRSGDLIATAGMAQWIRDCLKESDAAIWDEVIETTHIPSLVIRDIWTWLVAEYTERPFPQRSGSSPGASANGAGSTDDSPSPESNSETLVSTAT